ncbi:unnamed protein product [Ranitomeya imitator]|uniref:Reverse transcriptase n=1 Tax=Ranitomeya imitator TaxID=111125 RepID=A0ABN9MNI4_9NEOB|nr:unnamed protein product [Ranitomeya imitator]
MCSIERRYVAPMVPSVDPPAPVLVEGELEYVVEKILDSRISRRKLQYLVKWKGYGQEDNSWVFASDVHAADLVRAFHLAPPDRPGGSVGYHDFVLLVGSSGMQSGTSAPFDARSLTTAVWNLMAAAWSLEPDDGACRSCWMSGTKRLLSDVCRLSRKSVMVLSIFSFNDLKSSGVEELHRFFRNVRLKVHFSNIPDNISTRVTSPESRFSLDSLKLRVRSSFQPPRTHHPVETYIHFVEKDVKRLGDVDTYQLVNSNPSFETAREIKKFITHYLTLGIIDEKLGNYLLNQHPVLPVLYTLPKIHKHPSRPPGRPIVASTNSLLSPLAITLEKILSSLVPLIKSYLKDTSDFLKSLWDLGPISEGCLLVTMDVNSLYTSVNHEDGIRAVMSFLTEHTNFSHQQRDFCRDILTLILTKNFFIFEDQFFIQKRGTAMGSNMAPPYANIFMDSFEKAYVYSHPSFQSSVSYWRRYIDDVFLIWTGDIETLVAFHQDLNSSLPGLTFSISHSRSSMIFLDTMVNVNSEGFLETDLYVKPTDRNSLLRYHSCHPQHIKKSLPKSQHDRVERIVSKPEVSRMRHKEMDLKFLSRGYPPHILYTQRNTTRSQRDQNASRLAFVNTYHPFNNLINTCVTRHWDILKKAYPHIKEFNSIPIISNKRCPSIRDKLVRADVGSSKRELTQRVFSTPRNGTFPCLVCLQCSNIIKGDSFTHPRSGKRFSIKGHFTCNTTFVVYLIKCPCGLGYVGETTQHIRDRISQHKSTIRCCKTLLPVPAHFIQNNHTVAQLRYQVIEHVPLARRGGDRIKKLKERESFWIHTLQTLTPLGLNREYER